MDWFALFKDQLIVLTNNISDIEIVWVVLTGTALWSLWSKYPRIQGSVITQQEARLRERSKPLGRARINQALSRLYSRQIALVAVLVLFSLGIVTMLTPNSATISWAKTIYAIAFIFLANFIANRAIEVNYIWDRVDEDLEDHIALMEEESKHEIK